MAFRSLVLAAATTAILAGSIGVSLARDITHIMGTTSVPDAPLRIVALTNESTEDLVALGFTPVGAARSANSDPWYDYLKDALAETEVVGEEVAPNLEAIAALEPDLIIGNKRRHEKIYDQLSAIAPTVFAETTQGTWKENFLLYADTVGKAEDGAAIMQAYEAKAEKLRTELGDRKNETVTLVRFLAGQVYVYTSDSFSGVMINEAGLQRPAGQDKTGLAELITKERIGELDADRIVHFTYETGDGKADQEANDWMAEPLWQNLAAVKAGHVYAVSDTVWATSSGIMAANTALEDVAKIFEVSLD